MTFVNVLTGAFAHVQRNLARSAMETWALEWAEAEIELELLECSRHTPLCALAPCGFCAEINTARNKRAKYKTLFLEARARYRKWT